MQFCRCIYGAQWSLAYQVCWSASPIRSNAGTCSFAGAFVEHSCYWHTKFVEVRHPLNQMQACEVLQVHFGAQWSLAYQFNWSASSPIKLNAGMHSFAGAFTKHSGHWHTKFFAVLLISHLQYSTCRFAGTFTKHSDNWHTKLFTEMLINHLQCSTCHTCVRSDVLWHVHVPTRSAERTLTQYATHSGQRP